MDISQIPALKLKAMSAYKAWVACLVCRNAASRHVTEFLDHLAGSVGTGRTLQALAIPKMPVVLPVQLPSWITVVQPKFRPANAPTLVQEGAIVFYDQELVSTIETMTQGEYELCRAILVALGASLRKSAQDCCAKQILKRTWGKNPVRHGMKVKHQWRSQSSRRW